MIYTAGVKFLADEAKAYWLLDAIASHLPNPKLNREEFQVWHLRVEANRSARLWATDGNTDTPLVQQDIEYTDYPEGMCEMYLIRTPGEPDVLMLPVEY